MTKQREPFSAVGSYNEDPVLKINAADTVNMYEVIDRNIVSGSYLAYWPGKETSLTFTNGGTMRASVEHKGFAYFVVGSSVYRLDSSLTETIIGNSFFSTTTGYVGVTTNENQVIFVDGQSMFIWNIVTLTVDVPTLPTNVFPLDVTTMDASTIVLSNYSEHHERFYISALNDAASWNAPLGDFALVNSRATILQAVEVLKRRIFFFGEKVSEIWLDAGEADFPFRRDNNLLLEHGIVAKNTLVQGFDRLFYLSNDENGIGSVMMIEGTLPKPISTREIDERIQGFTAPEDALGFVFKINGLIFYQITFPHEDDNITFIYNVNFGKWHRAERLNGSADIARNHLYFNGKHYVGSYESDILYTISPELLTNSGERMRRIRVCPAFKRPSLNRIRIDRILLEFLQGVGNSRVAEDIDTNPRVHLWLSGDGAITYDYEDTADIGKSGERYQRTAWNRLGTRRETVIKYEIISNVPVYILSGVLDYEVMVE